MAFCISGIPDGSFPVPLSWQTPHRDWLAANLDVLVRSTCFLLLLRFYCHLHYVHLSRGSGPAFCSCCPFRDQIHRAAILTASCNICFPFGGLINPAVWGDKVYQHCLFCCFRNQESSLEPWPAFVDQPLFLNTGRKPSSVPGGCFLDNADLLLWRWVVSCLLTLCRQLPLLPSAPVTYLPKGLWTTEQGVL